MLVFPLAVALAVHAPLIPTAPLKIDQSSSSFPNGGDGFATFLFHHYSIKKVAMWVVGGIGSLVLG